MNNLLSNGIRFTSTSEVRRIELRFDLSFDPPAEGTCVMPAMPEKGPLLKDDMTVYLYVSVTDTGPGLTPKELDMLFQRFSQVSREYYPRATWHGIRRRIASDIDSQNAHHLWWFWPWSLCLS